MPEGGTSATHTSDSTAIWPLGFSAAVERLRANPSAPPPDTGYPQAILQYARAVELLRKERLALGTLSLAIVACTVVAVVGVLLQLRTRRKSSILLWVDLAVCFVCLELTWTYRTLLVILASNISVSYLTWISLPTSQETLPKHTEFMKDLVTASKELDSSPTRGDEECMICWDDTHPIARLPCPHSACTSCLQAMGEHNQTACPLCRTKLFTTSSDTEWIMWQKCRMSLYTSTCMLYAISTVYFIRRGEYGTILQDLGIVIPSTLLPLCMITRRVWKTGEDWWREQGTLQGAPFWFSVRSVVIAASVQMASKWLQIYAFDDT